MSQTPQTIIELFTLDNVDSSYTFVRNYVNVSVNDYYNLKTPNYRYTNCNYVRKNGTIDIPLIFDVAEKLNYVRYDNREGNGWEYAFITDKEFINFNMSRLTTSFDVWTNNLDKIKQCNDTMFIERCSGNYKDRTQHKQNDLNYEGDVKTQYFDFGANENIHYGIHVILNDEAVEPTQRSSLYCTTFTIDFIFGLGGQTIYDNDSTLEDVLQLINSPKTRSAYIYSLPTALEDILKRNRLSYETYNGYSVYSEVFTYEDPLPLSRRIYINDFKNIASYDDDKLYQYPYTKLKIFSSNNSIELNLANFSNNYIDIYTYYTFDSSTVTFLHTITDDFNNKYYLYDSACPLPIQTTQLETWLSQNSTFNEKFLFNSISKSLGDVRSMFNSGVNKSPTISKGGLDYIMGEVLNYSNLSNAPDNIVTTEDISKSRLFIFPGSLRYQYTYCSPEIANMISSYYNAYGYSYNKPINISYTIRTRNKYNYLKIKNPYFGFISCEEDKQKINSILSNGVRIYHYNISNPLDYGVLVNNNNNTYVGGI